jgi:hypothetical protein
MPVIKDLQTIDINDIKFTPLKGVEYRSDYVALSKAISKGDLPEIPVMRELVLTDLFFIVYFVLRIKEANHPFVVKKCREVESGPESMTLDVWARGHFKSTIITVAETIQYHLKNPENCTCIFSYKKGAAERFLDAVRKAYESDFLKTCFPDLLYDNPETQSPSWSVANGITINRENKSRPQKTVQASGLVEGMVTGDHFDRLIWDDVETDDIAEQPEQLQKCASKFDMSQNLGMTTGTTIKRVIGTFYSHAGVVVYIRDKKNLDGKPLFESRIIPATIDGTITGKPVLISQQSLDEKKTEQSFNSQQLCDPTPSGSSKLDSSWLIEIEPEEIPSPLHKFMVIDPAGDDDTKAKGTKGDYWGIHVIGIEGGVDDIGMMEAYILDSYIGTLGETEAINVITTMYLRNGIIMRTGYERNLNTTPGWLVHVLNALQVRQVVLSEEMQNLVRLKHGGRNKTMRIVSALQAPLLHGKIKISKGIPEVHRSNLKMELDKFPYWTQDGGVDALAYLYDLLDDLYVKEMLKTTPLGKRKGAKVLLFPNRDSFMSNGLAWMGG